VRHGHGPERAIQTGIGAVPVRRAKLRDRGAGEAFTSALLPKWARRTRSLDALLPVLYLRGISTGDFQEALAALLGKDAPSLSPSVIGRLKEEWQVEYDRWQRRELSASRATSSTLSTSGSLRGWWTTVRRRERSGRSSVTVKKKRSAETELLIPGGCMPACVWCSWKRRRSSAVAVSGERPMKAANAFTQRM
jgi:hypothetical protein